VNERDAEVSGNALSVGRRQVRLAEALDVELRSAVVTDDPRGGLVNGRRVRGGGEEDALGRGRMAVRRGVCGVH